MCSSLLSLFIMSGYGHIVGLIVERRIAVPFFHHLCIIAVVIVLVFLVVLAAFFLPFLL